MFWVFIGNIIRMRVVLEPILVRYIINLIPIIGQMFVVPILTMRLLSEENRTGTLEQMLTAPVNEGRIVLSKFFAALIFYLLTWLPWWGFLVALRVMYICVLPALVVPNMIGDGHKNLIVANLPAGCF